MNQVNPHTKSGADQGSAFHVSYRTRTAKLCSRISPRGEFCMRSFWHSYVFMKYILPTLFGGRRKIRSAVRLSPRPFPIGVWTKECIDERSALGGGFPLSEKYHRGNSGFYTVLQKVFMSSFNAIEFFLEKPILPKDIYRLSNHLSPNAPAIGRFSWMNRSPKDARHTPPIFLSQIFYPYA